MDFPSGPSMGEKSSQEDKSYSLSLADVSSDSLRIGTMSSTLHFITSSVSFSRIVLRSSSPIIRESSGSLKVSKTGVIALDEDEVLENIENKDSYLDELDLLVTPLSDANEDQCLDPGGDVDEIELLLHHDLSNPKISVVSILEGFTYEPPLEENDDLFDLESKENEWKKILYNASINDLMTEDKVFDPGIHEKIVSLTYVSLPFEDRHYRFFKYVI
nr:hypothetical protein [Tanacetum cinerariifolium]